MNFTRPERSRPAPPNRRTDLPKPPAAPLEHPLPDLNGTLIALAGLALTTLFATGEQSSHIARMASIGTIISIVLSVAMDMRLGGLRNLIRADLMAILAFYFLTLFEFLFPQPDFDGMLDANRTHEALLCVLLGFAGLVVGRHFYHPSKQPFRYTLTREIPPGWIVAIFWICMFTGYVHMLIAVDFDIVEVVKWTMEPRFSQPWQRGRLGDWKALLVELGLFIYLIPPLGGIMIARRQRYGIVALILVSIGVLFTFFCGFSSGTRYVFAAYLVTFLIAYAFALPFADRKELLFLCGGSAVLMVVASYFMLQFRSVGLHEYLAGEYEAPAAQEQTYFVDYNLYNIGRLMEFFPQKKDYLGWEIPIHALIRPIPRAVWPGKPEGLSSSIEDVLGVEGFTISASFVGEAFMSGGYVVVVIIALFFGALTGWWSHLASSQNSELGILIYASGFFATVISMRSLFVFTTALLPTVAALIIGTYAVRLLTAQAARLLARATLRSKAQQRLGLPPRPTRPPGRPPR